MCGGITGLGGLRNRFDVCDVVELAFWSSSVEVLLQGSAEVRVFMSRVREVVASELSEGEMATDVMAELSLELLLPRDPRSSHRVQGGRGERKGWTKH